MHTSLEREILSLAVTGAPSGAPAPDVGCAPQREHAAVEALTRRLLGSPAEGGLLEPDLDQLLAAVLDHCQVDEQSLFPALRRSPSEHRERLGWLLAGQRSAAGGGVCMRRPGDGRDVSSNLPGTKQDPGHGAGPRPGVPAPDTWAETVTLRCA